MKIGDFVHIYERMSFVIWYIVSTPYIYIYIYIYISFIDCNFLQKTIYQISNKYRKIIRANKHINKNETGATK